MDTEPKEFSGLKFWLAQRVPSRSHFIDQIKRHGGSVEPLEKNADIRIADHARKEQVPGTHSYTFIERSIRDRSLADLDEHRIGHPAGQPRIVGSVTQPAKGSRTKYTAAEDRILWEWVNAHPQKGGGTDGNEIYKQLEAKHPQHPWQSWRDRFIKKLKGRPPPSTILENGPPTPPLEVPNTHPQADPVEGTDRVRNTNRPFTDEDAKELLAEAENIDTIPPHRLHEAWEQFAEGDQRERGDLGHTAEEWQQFWEEVVRPRFKASQLRQKISSANNVHSDEEESLRSSSDHAPYLDAPEHADNSLSSSENQRGSPAPLASDSRRRDGTLSASTHPGKVHKAGNALPAPRVLNRPGVSPERENDGKLKRKRHETSGLSSRKRQVASSSPANRTAEHLRRREIPSTPDASPFKRKPRSPSPLFIEDEEQVEIKEEKQDSNRDEHPEIDGLSQDPEPFAQGLLSSLAQMERQRAGTQDLFRDRSPTIDLGVAQPKGGWEAASSREASPKIKSEDEDVKPDKQDDLVADESDHDEEDIEDFLEENDGPHRSTTLETQGFFREPTPMLDLDVAAPDGGFEALEAPASPPESRSSRQGAESESSSSDYGEQLDVFIENANAMGFPETATLATLRSTSLDTELTKKVLETMRKGKRKSRGEDGEWELPSDWKGVWTEADDEAITAVDGRLIERLIKKHGTESYDNRRHFLAAEQGG